jgi:hypothetical protein
MGRWHSVARSCCDRPPFIAIVRGWDSTGPFGPIGPKITAVSRSFRFMDKPATTWKELRQKIESQNKQLSLLLSDLKLTNKDLSLTLSQLQLTLSRLKSQNKKTKTVKTEAKFSHQKNRQKDLYSSPRMSCQPNKNAPKHTKTRPKTKINHLV